MSETKPGYKVGDAVAATHQIIDPADGDHPDWLLAEMGELLIVKEVLGPDGRNCGFDLEVYPESRPRLGFYCRFKEIRKVEQ